MYIGITGINEAQKVEQIKIYPNPTERMIRIEADENLNFTFLMLMDNQGKEVREYNGNERALDFSGLPDGVYFLQLQTEKGEVTEKIVVQ